MLLALATLAGMVGTNVHLPPSDTLDLEVDLGAKWIRIDFAWDVANPSQGQFDWTLFDTIVSTAKSRGLSIYATLSNTPAWASTGDRRGDGALNDVPNAAAYRAFVEAVAGRYQTQIDVFGIWNEPNVTGFFEGTRDEWINNVYRPGVQGVRTVCPTCVVAGPELATVGSHHAEYLQAALAAEVPSIIAMHIYAPFPEDTSGAGVTEDSFYNKLDMHRVIGPYQGQLSIREVALAAGLGNVPIWITETGREAGPTDSNALAAQQTYVLRVLDAMATRPWWGGTIFYELSEEHPGGAWPDIHWGIALRTHDPDATPLDNFQHKPAYDYLKARLAAMDEHDGVVDDAGNLGGSDAAIGPGEQPPGQPGCGCRTTRPADVLPVVAVLAFWRRRRISRGVAGSRSHRRSATHHRPTPESVCPA